MSDQEEVHWKMLVCNYWFTNKSQNCNKNSQFKWYIPFLSITPIGKGSLLGTVIRPRGPKGDAGFWAQTNIHNQTERIQCLFTIKVVPWNNFPV